MPDITQGEGNFHMRSMNKQGVSGCLGDLLGIILPSSVAIIIIRIPGSLLNNQYNGK